MDNHETETACDCGRYYCNFIKCTTCGKVRHPDHIWPGCTCPQGGDVDGAGDSSSSSAALFLVGFFTGGISTFLAWWLS